MIFSWNVTIVNEALLPLGKVTLFSQGAYFLTLFKDVTDTDG